ncbi:MAG: hypothetical protein Q8O14_12830 [bacterium]|nr:hypothetical protein [bacterium]
MQKVKAIGSIVVIGEHVLHPDRFTHFPDGVPADVAERTDLVEIVDGDAPELTSVFGMTADGVDKTGAVDGDGEGAVGDDNPTGGAGNGDDTNPGAGDDGLGGVTILHVDDDGEGEGEGGDAGPGVDPFADDATPPASPAPAMGAKAAAKIGTRTRTSSGGRR